MSALDITPLAGTASPNAPSEAAQPMSADEATEVLAQLASALDTAHLAASGVMQQVEARFRALVEQLPAVTFMAALDGGLNELYVSPQIETLLGYTQKEWLRNPVLWFARLHPDDRGLWSREFARGCRTGGPFRAECRFVARDGSIVWIRGEARIEKDAHGNPLFLQGLAYDITESKRAEEMIKASLREKETLLEEVHHRVKNNLQILSSLLKLQASRIEDGASRRALRESQTRIHSIALVHDMLYRSRDLSLIDFAEYVRRLVEHLARTYGPKSPTIAITTEIDAVWITVDKAIPCGLLISELVSNCFKHAFPGERKGRILVRFRATDEASELDVRDDGTGIPAGVDPARPSTLGLELVRTLTGQLHGEVELSSSDAGTAFRIKLPPDVVRGGEHG